MACNGTICSADCSLGFLGSDILAAKSQRMCSTQQSWQPLYTQKPYILVQVHLS